VFVTTPEEVIVLIDPPLVVGPVIMFETVTVTVGSVVKTVASWSLVTVMVVRASRSRGLGAMRSICDDSKSADVLPLRTTNEFWDVQLTLFDEN
jgi:hypothetical protein